MLAKLCFVVETVFPVQFFNGHPKQSLSLSLSLSTFISTEHNMEIMNLGNVKTFTTETDTMPLGTIQPIQCVNDAFDKQTVLVD